jgi:uncharacterized protein
MSDYTLQQGPLSEAELDRLAEFLSSNKNPDALTLEGLDGLFCALIASPERVLPSQYLPMIWGGELADENAFASEEEANATISLVLRHWNAILAELEGDGVHPPLVEERGVDGIVGRAWARGFMRGVSLAHDAWNELFQSELEGHLIAIPLVAGEIDPAWPEEPLTPAGNDELLISMGAGFLRSYRHFAAARRAVDRGLREEMTYRRAAPKTGRNDPCPCGSGQKYKRCCGVAGADSSSVH